MTQTLKRGALSLILAAGLAGAAQAQVVPPSPTSVPSPLSLSQAVAIALANQPQQWIAKTQERSASGTLEQAQSGYFPTVTPAYTYIYDHTSALGLSSAAGSSASSANAVTSQDGAKAVSSSASAYGIATGPTTTAGGAGTIQLSQIILDTGKRELTNAQARRDVDIARFGARNTREEVIDTVTEDYYSLLRAIDLVTVAQSQIKSAQVVVDQVQAQITAGTAAAASIYQAQATLANDQVSLIVDQAGVQTASATLKNEMGVSTPDVVNPVPLVPGGQLPPPPPDTPQPSLQDEIDTAYANRPDLMAEQQQVESGAIGVKLADVSAGLQGSATYGFLDEPYNQLGSTGSNSELLVSLSYPLFDGGYSRGAIRIAQAARDADKDTLTQDQEAVHLAVEQAYATRSSDLSAATLAQTALKAAQVNYDSAVAEQKEGLETVVDVVTAEATLAQSQDNYVVAVYNFYIADSALQRAIGRNDVVPVAP